MAFGYTPYSTPYQSPQGMYKPAKTGLMGAPPTNTNWASGAKPWDPNNYFSTPKSQTPGALPSQQVSTPAPYSGGFNYIDQGPQNQSVSAPMPDPSQQVSAPAPYSGGLTYQDSTPQNQQVSTPMPSSFSDPNAGAGASAGGQPTSSAFNTQYATLDNLKTYMNPFLDQIIARGNKAIQGSAAAQGLLGSSGTLNNIGDWTAKATEGAYNDARNAFNSDRGYMTDQYWNNRNSDTNAFNTANNFDWNTYQYGNNDYLSRLGGYNTGNNGIVNTGINASNNSGTIQGNLGQALSQLFGNQGGVLAQSSMNNGNNNSGLIGNLLSFLPYLVGG